MKAIKDISTVASLLFGIIIMTLASSANAMSCPASHPYVCGGNCYVDAAQAASGGCSNGGSSGGSNNGGSNNGGSNNGGSSNSGDQCPVQGRVVSGCRNADTQDWCDTVCVTYIGNGNDGCLNAEGNFVSRACVCSDPENAIESIIDIEYNLGIDIDDNFVANAGYIGAPPAINPGMTFSDALIYFKALLGDVEGQRFGDALNTNGDNWIDRNEASAAKGQDPSQTLTTSFGCGLSTDDVLAYVGLYLGDGAIDKYQGNLDSSVKDAMLQFTRTWQPGTSALGCEYRGGCDGSSGGNNGGSSGGGNNGGGNTGGGSSNSPRVVEAESGQIMGVASIYGDGAASGGQGVAYIYQNGAGFRINNAPAASSITLKYASALSGRISIEVNGSRSTVNFSSTGNWVNNYSNTTLNINVPQGAVVDVVYRNGDTAMNVDTITFN